MRQITITGPMPAAADLARQRYTQHTSSGLHVLLDAPGDLRNSLPERRMTAADLLVIAIDGPGQISEITTD